MFTREQWEFATSIYNQLGTSKRIIIRPWYGRVGVNKAKAIGAVFTLRVPEARLAKQGLILVPSVKEAVIAYIAWISFPNEKAPDSERATQIRSWLAQGVMKNKPLVYYKDLGEPSHAHALEWLIDNWQA